MKYKVTDVGKKDAFYSDKSNLVGKTGEWAKVQWLGKVKTTKKGWRVGNFKFDKPVTLESGVLTRQLFFRRIKVEPIGTPVNDTLFIPKEGQRVRITDIADYDAYKEDKLVGTIGKANMRPSICNSDWLAGEFDAETPVEFPFESLRRNFFFSGVRVEPVEEPKFLPTGVSEIDAAEVERVTITALAAYDYFVRFSRHFIGVTGSIKQHLPPAYTSGGGWYCASFIADEPISIEGKEETRFIFAGVKTAPISK